MNIETIPLITGLVAVAIKAGLPSRYAPILAVVLGIMLVLDKEISIASLATGVFYGLSAVGLWEAGKTANELAGKK